MSRFSENNYNKGSLSRTLPEYPTACHGEEWLLDKFLRQGLIPGCKVRDLFTTCLLVIVVFIAIFPAQAQAAEKPCSGIKLQIEIPGIGKCVEDLPHYINAIYNFFSATVGVMALTMMAIGAFRWILAAGNAERISKAQATVWGGIMGLMLVLGSFFILRTVSPRLVYLNFPPLPRPDVITLQTGLFCDEYKGKDNKSMQVVKYEPEDKNFEANMSKDALQKISADAADCPQDFVVLDGNQTKNSRTLCIGAKCLDEKQFCTQIGDNYEFGCAERTLGGTIKYTGNRYVDVLRLYKICDPALAVNGDYKIEQEELDPSGEPGEYNFAKLPSDFCGDAVNPKPVLGYFLYIQIHEGGKADDEFYVGKTGCKSQTEPIYYELDIGDGEGKKKYYNSFSYKGWQNLKDKLWTFDDLEKGLKCNINITCDKGHCLFPKLDGANPY